MKPLGKRERGRERETDRERDREGDRERQRERDRETESQRESLRVFREIESSTKVGNQALVPKATADRLGTHAAVQGRGPSWSCWSAAAGVHRVHVEVR